LKLGKNKHQHPKDKWL